MLRAIRVSLATAVVLGVTIVGAAAHEAAFQGETEQVFAGQAFVQREYVERGYVDAEGLEMYYEIHGAGEPLVLLHGALMKAEDMAPLVAAFAGDRRVIVIEQQAHGRTADVDRPLTYEQMAEDTAAALRRLGVERADFFGYSMGGNVALQIAVRHPELVRKLVVAAAPFRADGVHPISKQFAEMMSADLFPQEWVEAYARVAKDPGGFPRLVSKVRDLELSFEGWPAEEIGTIEAPVMIIVGDSDVVRLEHAVEMFQLFGGGVHGDLAGLPQARLAVLPGTTHIGVMFRNDWLSSMIREFLESPSNGAF